MQYRLWYIPTSDYEAPNGDILGLDSLSEADQVLSTLLTDFESAGIGCVICLRAYKQIFDTDQPIVKQVTFVV